MVTKTIYREIEVEVEVDLSDFDDEEIENEYIDRGGKDPNEFWIEARRLVQTGSSDTAIASWLRGAINDEFGTAY